MPAQTLPGTVTQAAPGLRGCDVNQVLTPAQATELKNAGYDFCIRYIPRTAQLIAGNVTYAEAMGILNANMAFMVVQHVALPNWEPNQALGTAYGSYAVTYLQEFVGLPQGVTVWLDLESVNTNSPAADVIAYCQAWYTAVNSAGFVPGIYVGWQPGLTPQQLYSNLSFQHYWRAYNGDGVAQRGYQLIQGTQVNVGAMQIDPDTTQNDAMGDAVQWLSLASEA